MSFESNWTPKTLIDDFDVMLTPFNDIVIGSLSILWNKQNSVLFSLILRPESFSHFEMRLNFSSKISLNNELLN